MTGPNPGPPELQAWEPPRLASDQKSVFHYTNAAGLLGAIESGTLWATEAAGLNDTGEVDQGWATVRAWLAAQPESPVVAELTSAVDTPINLRMGPLAEPYVLCASLEGDDAGQWRLYADHGRGYAIELDPTASLVVTSRLEPSMSLMGIEEFEDVAFTHPWASVAYRDEQVDEAMRSVVDWATVTTETADYGFGWTALAVEYLINQALYRVAACIKGPGFAGEREARVLTVFDHGSRHADFYAGAYGVVRHVRLTESGHPWGNEPQIILNDTDGSGRPRRLPILSVTLGPAHNPRLAARAIQALLWRHDYDVPVHGSKVTLR